MSAAAHAADPGVVDIPDPVLKAAINRTLAAVTFEPHDDAQPVTVEEAALVTTLATSRFTGPVADLTGVQALTNLTTFQLPANQTNTFTDLSPLTGLAKLATVGLINSQISDLSPLSAMSSLRSLTLTNNKISDVSPLAGLTGLTTLGLGANQIADVGSLSGLDALTGLTLTDNKLADLAGFPALPALVSLYLNTNKIADVTPLADKFTKTVLATVNLSGNKLTDASALAPYGNGGGKLGGATVATTGLLLGNNKIKDFSAFSGWSKPPVGAKVSGQRIYVGPYTDGGVHVSLKTADSPPTLQLIPVEAGSYDRDAGLLTLTDAPVGSVGVAASTQPGTAIWTVSFSVDPEGPPQVTAPGGKAAEVGAAITPFTVTAVGGTPPYTWGATGLPTGLSIDPASGEVSGTPTEAGAPTVTVTATDANSQHGSATFTFTVTAAPTAPEVTNPGNKSVPVGAAITPFTVAATGGVTPYSWGAIGLPVGLSIDPASGVVSGTPTAVGTATVTATATDAGSRTGSATFTISVTNAPTAVAIPDPNLKAAINAALARQLGTSRSATQDVTPALAAQLVNLEEVDFPVGPIGDLTGLEAFTNLKNLYYSAFQQTNNTFSDLTPLSGLTKLTYVGLVNAQVRDVTPLTGLDKLTGLALGNNAITDPSPLASLTGLTSLSLGSNEISDVSRVPALPKLAAIDLSDNGIRDPAPLVGKFDPDVLTTLDLSDNRIGDATSLAPLGRNGARLGSQLSFGDGLKLENNRIADFSAFSDWTGHNALRVAGQSIYVGSYRAGGINVTLKTDVASVPVVTPGTAGSYNPATGLLTVTDPTADSVTLITSASTYTTWTVYFSIAPLEGDEDGPVFTGTPQVGQLLSATTPAAAFADAACIGAGALSYRWLRDGDEITGNPHFMTLNQIGGTSGSMGGPATSAQYRVSVPDLGHQLQVRSTCKATGATSTSAPVAITTSEAEVPLVQSLEGPNGYRAVSEIDPVITITAPAPSGVVGDPTNPAIPISVAQLDAAGRLVDPAGIQVTLADIHDIPGGTPGIAADDVDVIGSGAQRSIVIDPKAPANVQLTFTVTGTTGKTSAFRFGYLASRATTPTSRVLMGSSDASTAIGVGDGHVLVADDEKNTVRLYDGEVSGREVGEFRIGTDLGAGTEIDAEASARKGDRIWWFGSHGNSKAGEVEVSRHSIYETKLAGTGADARLTTVGVRYGDLRNDLIEWDDNHGARFGFHTGAAKDMSPDAINGFNIEGAEFSPDGSELYLGFRSPLTPAQIGGRALIVPLTNLEALTSGAVTRATFGEPILLDLGGDRIREIRKNDRDEYLILGATDSGSKLAPTQHLWAWNGDPDIAPQLLTTVVPDAVETRYTDTQGAWEGIGAMPDRLVPGAHVRLIMDQGYVQLYPGKGENKDDPNDWGNKARTDVVTLAGPVGTLAEVSDPGAFPDQAVNTIGSARTVTVTNTGSNLLHVDAVSTEADDESATDYLIAGDRCSAKTLEPDETCTIRVRFAPSRAGATSNAELVVESDVQGGSTSVPLTGTATAPPKATPAVSAGSSTVSAGQSATIPVQVAGNAATLPTGVVTLSSGGHSVGSATLAAGSATFTVPSTSLTSGANLFTVEYVGDSAYTGASTQVAVTVTVATTQKGAASVNARAVKVAYGRSGQVVVQVSGGGATQPTGPVTLRDGAQVVGSAQLTQGTATVTVPASALSAGVNLFTVEYAGDTAYNASSAPVMVDVDKAVSRVSAKPTSQVTARKRVPLKISVSAPAGVSKSGLVTVLAAGKTATVPVVNGRATVRLLFRAAGTSKVHLSYAGNDELTGSTDTVKIKVKPAKKHKKQRARVGVQPMHSWWADRAALG
ncbi:leucine-rich repeat domain-containing protein [Nocardioides endophyticus]|uniref:leucine-rich repeat domain-containing protein n=1 Tax=Nocardioides endophyticus TaxID=1353775 RepID=UPI0031EF88E2